VKRLSSWSKLVLLCVQLKRPFIAQAALIGLLKGEYMFYTQHCNRRQTKESLCRVPSEMNRVGRAVIYTEFDNSTNGWHGQHRKCVESSLFVNLFRSRERTVCKKFSNVLQTGLFLDWRESLVFHFHNNYFVSVQIQKWLGEGHGHCLVLCTCC